MKLDTGDILTRFVQKCPKFWRIFVVNIFLEKIDVTFAIFEIWGLIQKMEKILILNQFFSFFIMNPLMVCPVNWIWWHNLFY